MKAAITTTDLEENDVTHKVFTFAHCQHCLRFFANVSGMHFVHLCPKANRLVPIEPQLAYWAGEFR